MSPDAPPAGRQAERSTATRAALVAAARRLFGDRGYAGVGTEEIVRAAGVTRGALYHHFGGKQELLEAAYRQVEEELTARIAEQALARSGGAGIDELLAGVTLFLDACTDPEVQQIVLLDAPAVLGWERWREIAASYGLGLIKGALEAAMEGGQIPRRPVEPLAHVLMGALDEAAMLVARSPDAGTRAEVEAVLAQIMDGLSRDARR